MVFVTGPFQAPDEGNHFFRAYQIAEGRLLAVRMGQKVGGWLPTEVVDVVAPFSYVPFHPDQKIDTALLSTLVRKPVGGERTFVDYPNTALNAPIIYLPQAA
jgi:hypothetical protein